MTEIYVVIQRRHSVEEKTKGKKYIYQVSVGAKQWEGKFTSEMLSISRGEKQQEQGRNSRVVEWNTVCTAEEMES